MTVDRFAAYFPEDMTAEQLACSRYLERKGLRFMIDFGYISAPAIVWAEMDADWRVQ